MENNINWHVSYEEAEASIHNAVNSYYIHNLNNNELTQEEAIQLTADYAEKGLEYLDEFQQAENAQMEQNGAVTEAVNGIEGTGIADGTAASDGPGAGDGGPGAGDDGGIE